MESYRACPRCGHKVGKSFFSNYMVVNVCLERGCETKYCPECGGNKCPECGSSSRMEIGKIYSE
jgi:hypothetical protein